MNGSMLISDWVITGLEVSVKKMSIVEVNQSFEHVINMWFVLFVVEM